MVRRNRKQLQKDRPSRFAKASCDGGYLARNIICEVSPPTLSHNTTENLRYKNPYNKSMINLDTYFDSYKSENAVMFNFRDGKYKFVPPVIKTPYRFSAVFRERLLIQFVFWRRHVCS